MKKKNTGFTLIEMLAVIVVLAILILLTTSSVVPLVTTARKNALGIEGNKLIEAGKSAYQMAILDGKVTNGSACFSLEYLFNQQYFPKGPSDKYSGSVLVAVDSNKKVSYTFWISNGSYVFDNAKSGTVGSAGKDGAKASENCGGASVEYRPAANG